MTKSLFIVQVKGQKEEGIIKIQAKVRRELQLIELDLDYLAREDTAVCKIGGVATTTLHMTRKLDGKIFYEVNKEIGSQLCGLAEGMRKLKRLLEPEID